MKDTTKLFIVFNVSMLLSFASLVSCDDSDSVSPMHNMDLASKKKNQNSTFTKEQSVANVIYEEYLEGSSPFSTAHSMDIGSWDYALQYLTSPAYKGVKSARFEIREDQPLVADGKRAEVVIVKGADGEIGKNTWYSFAVYFPSSYVYDDQREVINQWYQSGSPATSLRTEEDRIILETGNTSSTRKEIDLGPVTKETWHTFVFHFIHSYNSDGLIDVWHNGDKILSHSGGNMYDDVLPKWKIGLYKSAFKYPGKSDVKSRVIFFDNIRVGNENATYEEMAPENQ